MSHLELLNPPDSVVQASAALAQACRTWLPTVVSDALPLPSNNVPLQAPPPIEAWLCNGILHPETQAQQVLALMMLAAVATCAVLACGWVLRLHRLPAVLLRLVCQGLVFAKRKGSS